MMVRGILAVGLPGPLEWVVIGVVLWLGFRGFGWHSLIARSVGKGIDEFKKGLVGR